MGNTDITINGMSLASIGTTLLAGAYKALLMPPSLKDFVQNDDPLKDGIDVLVPGADGPGVPRVKERDVTLTFLIQGGNTADFMAHYAAFIAEMAKGAVALYVPELGTTYHLLYSSSTQFDNYRLNACKIAVKFKEPNPRSAYDADTDTTTDTLGIRWYKTPAVVTVGNPPNKVTGYASKPIHMASIPEQFHRKTDGQTIYYYTPEDVLTICKRVAELYGIPVSDLGDAFYAQAALGNFSRALYQVETTGSALAIGETIVATYTDMGHYHNGVWKQANTIFMPDEENPSLMEIQGDELVSVSLEGAAIPLVLVKLSQE